MNAYFFVYNGFNQSTMFNSRPKETDDFDDGFQFKFQSVQEQVDEEDVIRVYDNILRYGEKDFDKYLTEYTEIFDKKYFLSILKFIDKFDCRIQSLIPLIDEHEKLKKVLSRLKDIKEEYKEVLQDIVYFSSIYFYKIRRKKAQIKILSFQAASLNRVWEVLSTYKDKVTKKSNPYYWDILTSSMYQKGNPVQRMFILSQVLNMKSLFFASVFNDGLYELLYNRKDLFLWILNCSGKIEQAYLNSCSAASLVNEILTFNHTITSLFIISKELLKTVKKEIKKIEDSKIQEYAEKLSDQTLVNLNEAYFHLKSLLGSTKYNEKEERQIISIWGKSIEELCLLLDPKDIAAPSENVIKTNYHVSSFFSLVNVLFSPRNEENKPPKLEMYAKGADLKDLIHITDEFLIVRRIDDKEPVFNEEMWKRITFNIGNPISRVDFVLGPHQMYIKTAMRGQDRYFLICDPLIVGIQEFTIADMKDFVKKNTVNFE